MRVTVPSGHVLEFRDVFMRGDIRAAKRGIQIVTQPDGTRHISGSFLEDLTGRVVTRMLIGWNFDGQQLPSAAQTEDLQQGILDQVLDSADWKAVSAAVGPWVEVCAGVERADVFTHAATGIRVLPATAADAQAMDGNPDFAREDEADPKAGSTPTAITS